MKTNVNIYVGTKTQLVNQTVMCAIVAMGTKNVCNLNKQIIRVSLFFYLLYKRHDIKNYLKQLSYLIIIKKHQAVPDVGRTTPVFISVLVLLHYFKRTKKH